MAPFRPELKKGSLGDEKPGERTRCFYRLMPEGRRILAAELNTWRDYVSAVDAILDGSDA